ncbi:MAG: hypothetical protein JO171_18505 [Paludibacterium sp.]|uniref:hypothetical protein n=1 Tax=Paludibacterium sp. TaxID=1917523 RepID=UPI0025CF1008|nr:hypothetical protein [Paludibacterium sp.]MBV8049146.1 hypothetical protein [Paludibacterium sp.]MBV8646984.1 hypothetical protein [Paludibacterium sp.]
MSKPSMTYANAAPKPRAKQEDKKRPAQHASAVVSVRKASGSWVSRTHVQPSAAKVSEAKRSFSQQPLDDLVARVAAAVTEVVAQRPATVDGLVDGLMTSVSLDPAAEALLAWHAQRNAEARKDFIAKCGVLLSADKVADVLGSEAKNRAAQASRLKSENKVLVVHLQGRDYFPSFQLDLDNQRPYPEMAELLLVLAPVYEPGWQAAIWFVTPNAWLAGQEPMALWPRQRLRVLAAAHAEAEVMDD